jgi:sugar/nucleoside kinase (ribokinase family)
VNDSRNQVLVLGAVTDDMLLTIGSREPAIARSGLGGIVYAAAPLALLDCHPSLAGNVSSVLRERLESLLEPIGVDLGHVQWTAAAPYRVHLLRLAELPHAIEVASSVPQALTPLELGRLARRARWSCAYVNMVSGFEVGPAALASLAEATPVYLDYHMLSSGIDARGLRYRRVHPQWRELVASAWCVQLNLNEFTELALEVGVGGFAFVDQVVGLIDMLPSRVRAVIVTRGADGATFAVRRNGRVAVGESERAACSWSPAGQVVGTGDGFGAGVAASLIAEAGGISLESLSRAVRVGSQVARCAVMTREHGALHRAIRQAVGHPGRRASDV